MPDQVETGSQSRPSLGLVLELGVNAERLTEVFLMQPPDTISGCNAIVPFDDEYAGVAVLVDE